MSFRDLLKSPLPSSKGKENLSFHYEDGDNCDPNLTITDIKELSGTDVEQCGDLSCDEAARVDTLIKRLGTPIVVTDMLGEDDVAVFKESTDVDIALDESYFTERTIVRFDKNARKSQLKKVAVFAIAKEKKDPLYKKLNTVWKLERNLEAKLFQKYGVQADARVRQYISNAKRSKSSMIKNIAKKLAA